MADPFTIGLAVAGTVATAVGGGISAYGQSEAGKAANKRAQYQAGIAEMNAKIAEQNSQYILDATGKNAERQGIQVGQIIGQQKTAQAAGGFDVNSGSNEIVRDTTREIGKQDQATIRREGDIKALGMRNRAKTLEAEASGTRMAGADAERAGDISALGTLVSTAGSVASKWGQASTSFGSPSSPSGVTTYDENFNVAGWYK